MNPACTGNVIALTLMLTLTGIQYKKYTAPAQVSDGGNCDLILETCDFFNKYATNDPGEWVAESRVCFDGTLTLPSPLSSHPHLSRRPPHLPPASA